MPNIAIIPARGGSKRIPRKNIRDFLGKPILAYGIDAAINSKLFDKVIVSTDDTEIAEIAKRYGAEVPFLRSAENSNDTATTADVLLEVFDWYDKQGVRFSDAACIYPCAPFVSPELFQQAQSILRQQHADCVFPVVRYGHPIQRALRRSEDGKMSMFFDGDINARTQDLQSAFHDAGMFYYFDVKKLMQTRSLYTSNTFVIEVDENDAQDIDSETDWKLAELKFKHSRT